MKKKKQSNQEELNFWQPASDMFSALLLVLMLVILLLGLYLVHVPDQDQPDPWEGDSFDAESGEIEGGGSVVSPSPTAFIWIPGGEDGDGGGALETPHPTFVGVGPSESPSPSPSPTVSPTPDLPGSGGGSGGGEGGGNGQGEGPGEEPDVGMKSAVYVMLVDAETDRTIKQANVEFELYGLDNALQILNTYYPERVTYRRYETTEDGTFYFPEKLIWGEYELHELTEPEGYDAGENVPFVLDAMYDWPEPLVVRMPVYPSRNIVRVQLADMKTGLPVSGGSFEVVAAEDITTADGTLRYRTGQVAGEIVCDETGYGESEEIYLGRYYLRQKEIPRYYAGIPEPLEVTVEKKSNVQPETARIECERTTVHARLTDELYNTRGIAHVAYRGIASRGGAEMLEAVTGNSGEFVLDELEKGVTYRIRQVEPAEGYLPDNRDYTVTVSADGRIDGLTEAELPMTSRMIRVQMGITDEFSSVQVPGVNLALYTRAGEMVRTWTSSGAALVLESLEPGSYYLVKNGETESHYDINIRDTAELQTINIYTSYSMFYVMIGAAAVLLIVGTVLAVVLLRRRKKKKAVGEQTQGKE